MRRVLNTDCTDYTDNLFGDADSSLSSVVRSVFEHGLHGLHGCFLRTWIFLGVPWCVWGSEHGFHGLHGCFLLGGGVKTGGFGPIVRKHKIIREIRVIRVQ